MGLVMTFGIISDKVQWGVHERGYEGFLGRGFVTYIPTNVRKRITQTTVQTIRIYTKQCHAYVYPKDTIPSQHPQNVRHLRFQTGQTGQHHIPEGNDISWTDDI